MESPQSAIKPTPFFTLPPELREYIYEYALADSQPIVVDQEGVHQPSILLTCRLIRKEALPISRRVSTFMISAPSYDYSIADAFFKRASHHTNSVSGQNISFAIGIQRGSPMEHGEWDRLSSWLKAYYDGKAFHPREAEDNGYRSMPNMVFNNFFELRRTGWERAWALELIASWYVMMRPERSIFGSPTLPTESGESTNGQD